MSQGVDVTPPTTAVPEPTDRGLAQVLAAALWEAEPDGDEPAVPPPRSVEPSAAGLPATDLAATDLADVPPPWWTDRFDELLRLQVRQTNHVEKLYAENRDLREGELAVAMTPLVLGLAKLSDQMSLLATSEGAGGSAALLRTQLLQVLETAAGIVAFEARAGEPFDVVSQRGVRAVDTGDPTLDGRVSCTVRPGFLRADGSVVRVAEVEVLRHRGAPAAAATADES